MSTNEDYSGYGWIKVPRATAKWAGDIGPACKVVSEEHHIAETTFLIEEVRKLAAERDALRRANANLRNQLDSQRREQSRRLRWEQDSLPYYEDDRDGG